MSDRLLLWLGVALIVLSLFWMTWIIMSPPHRSLSPSQSIQSISEP